MPDAPDAPDKTVLPPDFHRRLLDNASDAVLFADAKGDILYWNAGAERIFGFSVAEAIGKTLDLVVPEAQRARHWQGFEKTMATGVTRYAAGETLATPAMRKDGQRISVEFSIIPLLDDEGRMLGVAAIMRDVTQRFEALQALRKAAAQRTGLP